MLRILARTLALGLALPTLLSVAPARANLTLPTGFRDSTIYSGIGLPVAMAFLPGPPEKGWRLLITEQKGQRVSELVNGVPGPTPPFQQVSEVDWVAGERGCLSLAVDPRWPAQPYIYLHYTSFGAIHLVRYRMTGDLTFAGNGLVSMDTTTKMYVLTDIPDVNENHNGGTLRFGPDGMLYMTTGDDQNACNSQDTTSLGGKVLRMDITTLPAIGRGPFPHALITPADNPHAASPDEHYRLVYAMGLRNPFRMHIDPANGALFIADVGQIGIEEINRITGAANMGWPWYEGSTPVITCGPTAPTGLTLPIATLPNPPNQSIMSMGVYRAPSGATKPFPAEYEGDYFFTDYFTGVVRRIGWNGSLWAPKPAPGQPTADDWATGAPEFVDAAVGADGALWYLLQGVDGQYTNGAVHRVAWDPPTAGVPPDVASGVRLAVPSPNPMRGAAEFAWSLPARGTVRLTIHDLAGRLVATLESGERSAGPHRSRWEGRDASGTLLAPGVYVANLSVGTERRAVRFVLAR
jgi:glucose/arabinose dehydrogenase